jgi:hypothetical protein
MKAGYKSKCAVCGEWIEVGEDIELLDDEEWVHADCARD